MPAWVVVGAGTGGTSATIGRYVRYRRYDTRVCVVDPENCAFFDGWCDRRPDVVTGRGSRIEGIGRPRVEPSFMPVGGRRDDRGARRRLDRRDALVPRGSPAGWSAARPAPRCGARCGWSPRCAPTGEPGSVVTLLCDGGERYAATYYDDDWLAEQGIDIAPYTATLEKFYDTGTWDEVSDG